MVYPKPDRNVSLLFIYDGEGTLRRTLVFPDRLGTASDSGGLTGFIKRTPSGNRFMLRFHHRVFPNERNNSASTDEWESYLMDGGGNLLGRYVDEEERAVEVSQVSDNDTYAFGVKALSDGTYKHYLFKLPSKAPTPGNVPPSPDIMPQSQKK